MRISDWSSDVCSSDLRNPLFSSCAEIAVGIACDAGQTVIEVGNAIGTEITRAKACRHRAKYTRNIPDGLCRVAPPIFGASIEREFFGGLPRDHVDDAANGLTAPKYGLRPSHDFDSLDIAGEQIAEVEAAAGRGRIVQLYPIDEGNGLLAFRAPDVDRRC